MDVTSAESKATYQEIKDYVLEHSGMKMSSLYIAIEDALKHFGLI